MYDRPADAVGFSSVPIPEGDVSRVLRKGTSLYRDIGGLIPGFAYKWLNRNLGP